MSAKPADEGAKALAGVSFLLRKGRARVAIGGLEAITYLVIPAVAKRSAGTQARRHCIAPRSPAGYAARDDKMIVKAVASAQRQQTRVAILERSQ